MSTEAISKVEANIRKNTALLSHRMRLAFEKANQCKHDMLLKKNFQS